MTYIQYMKFRKFDDTYNKINVNVAFFRRKYIKLYEKKRRIQREKNECESVEYGVIYNFFRME